MNFLLIFFTSLIFTIFFTPYFITYLKKTKVVDLPGNRRIHSDIVPRMGGLLIFLVVSVMLLSFTEELNSVRLMIIAANIILLVGIFDDMLGLDYSAKFLLQLSSAVLLLFFLAPKFVKLKLFEVTVPYPLDYILLLLFIIGGINAINLLDGMDGLVSGFSLLVFSIIMALAVISHNTLLLILTTSLMGSILGFLKYNAYPAKIFLGDTGSLTLGFFLVVTSLLTSINFSQGVLDLTFPIMLLAIPLVDTVRVMIMRILRKQNPFLPDKTHLHHVISGSSISHKFTVFFIESLTVIFIIISLYYIKVSHFVPLILFFILVAMLVFIEPIMKLIGRFIEIDYEFELFRKLPLRKVVVFEKGLIFLSSLMIAFIIIASFPQSTNLQTSILMTFFIIGLIMFFLAYGHQRKQKDASDIYTFINLAAFFTITNLNTPAMFNLSLSSVNLGQLTEISYYILALIIILFLIASDKFFPFKKIILNGIDLTVIVFILLTFIVNSFIKFYFDEYFSISFLEAFIFYLWYKVIISIKAEVTNVLFYASFALPFAAILLLLLV
ncbi:MAG TPA: MraY family glycosyltransferase [Ignavibacteriales bacterium]|nr:MraY family glycosyltransferase [Ignavibacteriales bacterium]